MITVEEFACGISLRTGTLILAWVQLMSGWFEFAKKLTFLFQLHNANNNYNTPLIYIPPAVRRFDDKWKDKIPSEWFWTAYGLMDSIVAVVVSVIAIWAMQKGKIKYLNGLYWCFCYNVFYFTCKAISTIYNPTWVFHSAVQLLALLNFEEMYSLRIITSELTISQIRIIAAVFYLFVIALLSYFTLVVKSYIYYVRQPPTHAEPGHNEGTVPIYGYKNNVQV